jgi:hypothetical protein
MYQYTACSDAVTISTNNAASIPVSKATRQGIEPVLTNIKVLSVNSLVLANPFESQHKVQGVAVDSTLGNSVPG